MAQHELVHIEQVSRLPGRDAYSIPLRWKCDGSNLGVVDIVMTGPDVQQAKRLPDTERFWSALALVGAVQFEQAVRQGQRRDRWELDNIVVDPPLAQVMTYAEGTEPLPDLHPGTLVHSFEVL